MMRWVPFIILACVTIVCQTTVVPRMTIQSVWPDWMFILAVHYALWGRWPDVAIAAWILGLVVDLHSSDRIGLHACTYGAAAWAIIHLRQALFRDHPLTQVAVTFVFALGIQLIVGWYRRWGEQPTVLDSLWWSAFLTAVYTAVCAPFLHWLLIRLKRWTGLQASRRFQTSR